MRMIVSDLDAGRITLTDRQEQVTRAMQQPAELWARAYAQYVTIRSGRADLTVSLAAFRHQPANELYIPV